eukprot:6819078-Prymnesium_polylepis.1
MRPTCFTRRNLASIGPWSRAAGASGSVVCSSVTLASPSRRRRCARSSSRGCALTRTRPRS